MNPEQIRAMLIKVVSDLQYIQKSEAFQAFLDTSAVNPEMGAIADTAILFATKLKHCYGSAVDKLDPIEASNEASL